VPGYTAPPEGRAQVSITIEQSLPAVPASSIDTGGWARAFQYELNQRLAADGLSAQVGVEASQDDPAGRRLHQAGTSQLEYTIVVMVPVGRDARQVRQRIAAGQSAAWRSCAACLA
jgi:hypothetical protein